MTLQQAINEDHNEVRTETQSGHVALPYTVECWCNRRPVKARNGRYVDGPWRVGVSVRISALDNDCLAGLSAGYTSWTLEEGRNPTAVRENVVALGQAIWKRYGLHLEVGPVVQEILRLATEALSLADAGRLPGIPQTRTVERADLGGNLQQDGRAL